MKMICEMYNKIYNIDDYIVCGGTDDIKCYYKSSVNLYEFVEMVFMCMLAVVFISWWMIPCRIISKPFSDRAKKITFKCKKEK